MPPASDRLGALGEVARVLNLGDVDQADRLLVAIEADPAHLVWQQIPIAAVHLRDRINAKRKSP